MKFKKQVIHADFNVDPATNAVAIPIYQTTSYSFRDSQHGANLFNLAETGNIYSRIMNTTCDVLEQRIQAAEGGAAALCMASGVAAITATVNTLCSADDNSSVQISYMAALITDLLILSLKKGYGFASHLATTQKRSKWRQTTKPKRFFVNRSETPRGASLTYHCFPKLPIVMVSQ